MSREDRLAQDNQDLEDEIYRLRTALKKIREECTGKVHAYSGFLPMTRLAKCAKWVDWAFKEEKSNG